MKRFAVMSVLLYLTISFAAEIHEAVTAGEIDQVRELLDADPGALDLRDRNGMTPLCLAAYTAQADVAALLIERGADPMIGDVDNSQPLHCCGISGSVAIAEMLLGIGVPVDGRDNNGMTALHFAASYGKSEMVELLIEHGADVNARNNREITPLIYTIFRADSLTASYFILHGADLYMKRSNGWNCLHYAAWMGRTDGLALLCKLGLNDVNACDDDGATPLHNAARTGKNDAVIFLVERGADVNAVDKYGWTILHNAAFNNSDLVSYLINKGADPNGGTGSELNTTPLHIATEICSLNSVRLLVEHGAKVNVTNDRGQTPLHLAVRSGRQDIVEYLLEHDAAVDDREAFLSRSLLHTAAANGYESIARALVTAGADPDTEDDNGLKPSVYAAYHGFGDLDGLFPPEPQVISTNALLERSLRSKEAFIWYLGHSGWAVRTANYFLIFDYNFDPRIEVPTSASLASGYVVPAQLKDQTVTVLTTHEHRDHYSPGCFEWREELPGITYVLGFTPRDSVPEHTSLQAGQTETVGGIEISAIRSIDAGVAFLIKVDGLVIFHAGDHANENVEMTGQFPKDIDSLAATGVTIDLAFFGITGCSLGDPESVCRGVHYAIEKLKPKALFPMHGGFRPDRYYTFADEAREKNYKTCVLCASDRGDAFLFQKGKARPFAFMQK